MAQKRTIVRVPTEINNKYRFAVIAGQRSAQLQLAAFPKVEVKVEADKTGQPLPAPRLASFWSNIAIQEVEQDRIGWKEEEVVEIDNTFTTPITIE